MSTKRSVTLRGCPTVNEEGVANTTIKPGYGVKGVSVIAVQDSAHKTTFALALERDELGAGIDNSLQGQGTGSANYADGDTVKVGVYAPGDEVTVFIASGQNLTEGDYLTNAGDGTFAETATVADFMAMSLETTGAVTEITAVRVRVV